MSEIKLDKDLEPTVKAVLLANGEMKFSLEDLIEAGRWELVITALPEDGEFIASVRPILDRFPPNTGATSHE